MKTIPSLLILNMLTPLAATDFGFYQRCFLCSATPVKPLRSLLIPISTQKTEINGALTHP